MEPISEEGEALPPHIAPPHTALAPIRRTSPGRMGTRPRAALYGRCPPAGQVDARQSHVQRLRHAARCALHGAARPRARHAGDGRAPKRARHRGQAQPERGSHGGAGPEVRDWQSTSSWSNPPTTNAHSRRSGKGDPRPQKLNYTIEQAEQAGLLAPTRSGKPSNWKKMPKQMLRARAKSELARLEYPDLLAGLYTPEELRDAKVEVA